MCAVSFGSTTETAEKRENKVYVIGHAVNDFATVEMIKAVLETENVAVHFIAEEKGISFKHVFAPFVFTLDYENLFIDTGGEYRQNYFKVKNESNKPNQFYNYNYNPQTYNKVKNKALHYRKSRDAI